MTSPEHVLGKLISDAVESALGAEFEVVYQWFYRLEESAHRPGLRRDLGLCATRKWDRMQCAYIFRDFHFQKGDVELAAASIQRWMNENGKEESMIDACPSRDEVPGAPHVFEHREGMTFRVCAFCGTKEPQTLRASTWWHCVGCGDPIFTHRVPTGACKNCGPTTWRTGRTSLESDGLRPVKLTRAEFVNLLSYFLDEDLQNRINDNLYEVRFAIDDDGLKFKINNYTWSAGTGKVER